MVRFIIEIFLISGRVNDIIYIPIWLDLLYNHKGIELLIKLYLHSNMVRFIIKKLDNLLKLQQLFTFQYG